MNARLGFRDAGKSTELFFKSDGPPWCGPKRISKLSQLVRPTIFLSSRSPGQIARIFPPCSNTTNADAALGELASMSSEKVGCAILRKVLSSDDAQITV